MNSIKNSKLTVATVLLASGGALAGSASAGIMSPPPFSGPMATYQCWTFPTPSTPTPPDPGFINPFGQPGMSVTGAATWIPQQFGKAGVWQLGIDPAGVTGALDFRIPNMEDLTKRKAVSIEIKYFGIPGTAFPPPVVSGQAFGAGAGPLNLTGFTTRPADNNPDWTIGTWTGFFDHCPLLENIRVEGNGNSAAPTIIDWVCIGTNCVPTPGAGALMSAGCLMLGVRRRRNA